MRRAPVGRAVGGLAPLFLSRPAQVCAKQVRATLWAGAPASLHTRPAQGTRQSRRAADVEKLNGAKVATERGEPRACQGQVREDGALQQGPVFCGVNLRPAQGAIT